MRRCRDRLVVWAYVLGGFAVAAVAARLLEPSLMWLAVPAAAGSWASDRRSE